MKDLVYTEYKKYIIQKIKRRNKNYANIPSLWNAGR